MATIKLDHIELLVGALNYAIWKRGISQVLQGEGYWGHVEGSPNQFAPFPSSPEPSPPDEKSAAEVITAYQEWWQKDSKARTIVERRISPVSRPWSDSTHHLGTSQHPLWSGRRDVPI